jgi:hypothetical protein
LSSRSADDSSTPGTVLLLLQLPPHQVRVTSSLPSAHCFSPHS